jgi:Kef-type K+ transport system membrane component KefB
MNDVTTELEYVALLFGLLVLPKVLQRFRLPSAVTTLVVGVALGTGLKLFTHDATVHLLATFGITALFLFAGLEVDTDSLRRGARVLVEHLAVSVISLAAFAWAGTRILGLGVRPAVLFALALLTPSTGFILDSLKALDVSDEERFWIRTKAIASELLALAILFVTLQSTSAGRLGLSALALLALAAFLPVVFRFFASRVLPYAPDSEFAFMLMVAVVCAYATKQLGVYYLVGAFLVGIVANRLRERLPRLASDRNVHAVEVFASFFIPFYFFNAGASVPRGALTWASVALGLLLAFLCIPVRVGLVVVQRGLTLREGWKQSIRVGIPLIPTLVFTLVLAQILAAQYALHAALYGALIVYTVVGTVIPTFVFGAPAAVVEFEQPPDGMVTGPGNDG